MDNNTLHEIQTIAFYNIENLFDTEDDEHTDDEDFLPNSKKRWTEKRYQNKLRKIGATIAQMGYNDTAPAIVGLAEVENESVVEDLIENKTLKSFNYDFVHYNSSDERGIDVAFIYKTSQFEVEHSETFSVYLEDKEGDRDYTRDILLVSGYLKGEYIHLIVNHWSSRREGEKETEFKRLAASNKVLSIISSLQDEHEDPKIIVMGDFNDNPNNKSITNLEDKAQLFNPFKTLWTRDRGSLNHNFEWHLFDQILFSTSFLHSISSKMDFHHADIYDDKFLTQYHGKFKGQPFRTYVGKKYKGGYSDHFPVFVQFKTEK
ncbi:MAG: endonuclease [Bacteroidota bacterium]